MELRRDYVKITDEITGEVIAEHIPTWEITNKLMDYYCTDKIFDELPNAVCDEILYACIDLGHMYMRKEYTGELETYLGCNIKSLA